ncbi:hypothetical protein HK405_005404, partial [Cladochytrium tenue]
KLATSVITKMVEAWGSAQKTSAAGNGVAAQVTVLTARPGESPEPTRRKGGSGGMGGDPMGSPRPTTPSGKVSEKRGRQAAQGSATNVVPIGVGGKNPLPGFEQFIYDSVVPALFQVPLKPGFDITDAQTVGVLTELALLHKRILIVQGPEYVEFLNAYLPTLQCPQQLVAQFTLALQQLPTKEFASVVKQTLDPEQLSGREVSESKQQIDIRLDRPTWHHRNFYAPSPRILNTRGQNIYDRLNIVMGVIFFLAAVIYAGVRGQRVVTQLPVTFRTTQTPKQLASDSFLSMLFPSTLPSATYEFPVVVLCPQDPAATLTLTSCAKTTTATTVNCSTAGISTSFVATAEATAGLASAGTVGACVAVNDSPGTVLAADSAADTLDIAVSVAGTRKGRPVGAYVLLQAQAGNASAYAPDADDLLVAAA